MYAIDCPFCHKPFMWFSGNQIQMCEECRKAAKITTLFFDGTKTIHEVVVEHNKENPDSAVTITKEESDE